MVTDETTSAVAAAPSTAVGTADRALAAEQPPGGAPADRVTVRMPADGAYLSVLPFVPAAPASLVASLKSWLSCGYFSKCGGLK